MDNLVLVGFNPRLESPLLNARILKAVRHKNLKVHKIGPAEDLTYDYNHLGSSVSILNDIKNKKHPRCE